MKLMNTFVRNLRALVAGRPLTKEDILRDRMRLCASAGIRPESIANFWVGIEGLRDSPLYRDLDQGSRGSRVQPAGSGPSIQPQH